MPETSTAAPSLPAPATPANAPDWLGHPRGLTVIFFTEMWERLSYYGMRALLVLYMLKHLFVQPDVGAELLGFNALKGALESAFGPLGPQALSSQIYGLYTGFVYLTPLFGGLLADRLLGRRKAVILGALLMAAGHFLMAIESAFLPALVLLATGNGCFKPNTSSQVGLMYARGDSRRDRAYTIFYVGVNVGAFLAPLVCGTLGQVVGWHWGFGAAGVGMLLGLVIYLLNQHHLPIETAPTTSATAPWLGTLAYIVGVPLMIVTSVAALALPKVLTLALAVAAVAACVYWISQLPRDERARVAALSVACLLTAAYWGVYEQQGNTLQIWADQSTAWPTVFGFTIPSTWYQSFNPFAIWLLVPLLNALWGWQQRRGTEPDSLSKMAWGCVITGAGYIVLVIGANTLEPGVKSSVLWLVASTLIFTIGEIYLSPIGLSFVSSMAPARLVSLMMGVWYLSSFFGNYAAGYLGSFYERMPHAQFFWMLLAIGVLSGLLMFALRRPLAKHLA